MARTIRILSDGSFINAGAKMAVDGQGIISFLQDPAATEILQFDWTGYLGTETISSSTWTSEQLTISSPTVSGKVAQVFVSNVPLNTHGGAHNTITTSSGRVQTREARFYGAKQ